MMCEVDHSPPSNAEVKNEWNYKSTPSYAFKTSTGEKFILWQFTRVLMMVYYIYDYWGLRKYTTFWESSSQRVAR